MIEGHISHIIMLSHGHMNCVRKIDCEIKIFAYCVENDGRQRKRKWVKIPTSQYGDIRKKFPVIAKSTNVDLIKQEI